LRVYLDEDSMSDALAESLRRAGFDVTSAADEDMRGQPDAGQLQFAARVRRVLYTSNVSDFRQLHDAYLAEGRHHSGIIVLPNQQTPIGVQLRWMERLGEVRSAEDMEDRLEFLSNWR
jgi:hypothetical protein